MKNDIDLEMQGKTTKSNSSNLKCWLAHSESDPGLQNVHRWRHKDDKRAQCSLERASNNSSGLFQ